LTWTRSGLPRADVASTVQRPRRGSVGRVGRELDRVGSAKSAERLTARHLAQAPLNLERHVSQDAVRAFKLVTRAEVGAIVAVMQRLLPGLTERDGVGLVAAATSMSGAFWQMATPGPQVAALYRSAPRLAHDAPSRTLG